MGLSGTGWGGEGEGLRGLWKGTGLSSGLTEASVCPGPQREAGGLDCGGGRDLALVKTLFGFSSLCASISPLVKWG